MSDGFRFKKGTQASTRNIWSVRAKAMALSLILEGKTAAEAIAVVAEQFGIDISETPSYTNNAGSHIGRFRVSLSNALASPSHKGHQEAIDACKEFGLEIESADETD